MPISDYFHFFKEAQSGAARAFLHRYFASLLILLLLALVIFIPWSVLWLYHSGDLALERAVKAQASGNFAIFGSGVSQNFMEYKLELYKSINPQICVVGSSRVMQIRGSWFTKPFVNMGGAAGNIAELRFAIEEMLKIHKPEGIIIGLDFWWFASKWEKEPHKTLEYKAGSYEYDLQKIRKPWQWLLEGKISLAEFFRPFTGYFSETGVPQRFGIMAQQYDEGFGPDGSWYNTAELIGKKPPFDYQFSDTLEQLESGIKAFYHVEPGHEAPEQDHLDAFCAIVKKIQNHGIRVWLFIPPLSEKAYEYMVKSPQFWPHLFKLQKSLLQRGLKVEDFSSPATLASSDCEFIDGFHGGEIAYARIMGIMGENYPGLRPFLNLKKIANIIRDWHGHAMSFNPELTSAPEIDFHDFNCPGKRASH